MLKSSQLNAQALSQSRFFSSKELFAAAGATYDQGKSLKLLGKMLDKYNAEVTSPDSKLSTTEKVIKTLQLREQAKMICVTIVAHWFATCTSNRKYWEACLQKWNTQTSSDL